MLKNTQLLIGPQAAKMIPIIEKSKKHKNSLLSVKFTSLSSYLWLLKVCSQILSHASETHQTPCLLYLAAAVSDFYVPTQEMPLHKIQSSQVCLVIVINVDLYNLAYFREPHPYSFLWSRRCYVLLLVNGLKNASLYHLNLKQIQKF